MIVHVNDWIEFEYTDLQGVTKKWKGELREKHPWGYRVMTEDGWRSFKWYKIKNLKVLV